MDTSSEVGSGLMNQLVCVSVLPASAFWQQTSPAVDKLQHQTQEEEARFLPFSLVAY